MICLFCLFVILKGESDEASFKKIAESMKKSRAVSEGLVTSETMRHCGLLVNYNW